MRFVPTSQGQHPRWPITVAVTLVISAIAALGVTGCGEEPGEEGEADVLIETDTGPVGLLSLRQDQASGTQNERVPVTTDGTPTAVYAVKLDDLETGVRVGALATVTLTKCAITDYIPNARSFTACEGTKRYTYDPVTVESRFTLVGGSKAPDLSAGGTGVGDSVRDHLHDGDPPLHDRPGG